MAVSSYKQLVILQGKISIVAFTFIMKERKILYMQIIFYKLKVVLEADASGSSLIFNLPKSCRRKLEEKKNCAFPMNTSKNYR